MSFAASIGKKDKVTTTTNKAVTVKKARSGKSPHLQYAGQIGVPSSFDSLLGSTTEVKESTNDLYSFETLTTLVPGSYADKYSLYPWSYTLK